MDWCPGSRRGSNLVELEGATVLTLVGLELQYRSGEASVL